jgi:S-adenosylmethionine:tRNA ribosyltransferase-isomerase
VHAENIEDHKMHEEAYCISDETASRIERAKAEGRKVLAVGTTSLRSLESAWQEGPPAYLQRGECGTSIFIYPPYTVKSADALFTNFHTPGSTLLMLVAAFAGLDFTLHCYKEAVKEGYRFFSYGDACLIL